MISGFGRWRQEDKTVKVCRLNLSCKRPHLKEKKIKKKKEGPEYLEFAPLLLFKSKITCEFLVLLCFCEVCLNF